MLIAAPLLRTSARGRDSVKQLFSKTCKDELESMEAITGEVSKNLGKGGQDS